MFATIEQSDDGGVFAIAPGHLEIVLDEAADDGHHWRACSLPEGVQVTAETWPAGDKPGRHRFTLIVAEDAEPGDASFIYVDPRFAHNKECDCIACGWLVDAPAHAVAERFAVRIFPVG